MLKELDIKNYLIRGSAWAFIGKLLTALMGLFLSALLARLLTPEEMGTYFLAFNLATFFSIFARAGLENTTLRLVSDALGMNNFYSAKIIIFKSLLLALISSITISTIIYFSLGQLVAEYLFTSKLLSSVIGFISIWLILLSFQFIYSEIFRAFQNINLSVLSGGLITSSLGVFFIFLFPFSRTTITLNQIILIVLISGVINFIISTFLLVKKIYNVSPSETSINTEVVNYFELISHSWPLLINTLTLFILTQSGLWIMALYFPESDVAIYGAAIRLVLLTGFALSVVNAVIPPLIARLNAKNNIKQLEYILRATATIAAIPSISILSIFIFSGGLVMELLYGHYYRTGGLLLTILSIGQLVNVLVGSCGYTLIMTGHQQIVMLITLSSAAITLICSFYLAQYYGGIGVSIGYTTGMIIQQFSMLIFAKLRCNIWTHVDFQSIWKYIKNNSIGINKNN